jgi:glutamate-1-semialdehyde 2,1-aminomutase
MKVIAITQARSGSTRLPGKILKEIAGKTLLQIHLERLKKSRLINHLIVATTTDPRDEIVCRLATSLGVASFRGSESNVLDRFYHAAKDHDPDYVVRITSDCPLIDPELVDKVIDVAIKNDSDYCSNVLTETFPDGQDIEVFRFDALKKAWINATLDSDKEHVTPYIRKNADVNNGKMFKALSYESDKYYGKVRMTVDQQEDFEVIKYLVETLGTDKTWNEYAELILAEKNVSAVNEHINRNEGYRQSIKKEQNRMDTRYKKSEEFLKRALKTVPLGSQTFSKSKTQLPIGVSPFFASKGSGSHIWDVDGNEYVDFVNSLASITLGYNDPDVTKAVSEQLQNGTIYSLSHELEFKVAEKITEMVPCAEMVRFGKNGSDATAGAIRVARAYTKKDHVLVCGYHGWQDWYIGSTTRDLGVPQAVKDLTHKFFYNDIQSLETKLEELKGKVAAVILEPVNVVAPQENFLQKVKELTHHHGAVLIFDETITGFRYANGGAQEFFNVIPDLACFGKGLANGYPVSAVAGKAEIMKLMEDIFFSFTFGGETLSLAASYAVLNKLQKEPVVKTLFETGEKVINGLNAIINEFGLNEVFSVSGYPVWSFLIIKDTPKYNSWELKTLLLQEMFANGIFMIGTHNISFSHSKEDVESLLRSYRAYFEKVKIALEKNNLSSMLRCEPLKPLFKVR